MQKAPHILICDDQRIIHETLGIYLENEGFTYASAFDGIQALDMVEYAITRQPFIAGERFTAADLYVGSHLGFGMMFGTIEKRPAFEAYYAGLKDRPAALRATALDDAAMPKQA